MRRRPTGGAIEAAVNAMEEVEETAKLHLLLHRRETRYLTPDQVAALMRQHPIP